MSRSFVKRQNFFSVVSACERKQFSSLVLIFSWQRWRKPLNKTWATEHESFPDFLSAADTSLSSFSSAKAFDYNNFFCTSPEIQRGRLTGQTGVFIFVFYYFILAPFGNLVSRALSLPLPRASFGITSAKRKTRAAGQTLALRVLSAGEALRENLNNGSEGNYVHISVTAFRIRKIGGCIQLWTLFSMVVINFDNEAANSFTTGGGKRYQHRSTSRFMGVVRYHFRLSFYIGHFRAVQDGPQHFYVGVPVPGKGAQMVRKMDCKYHIFILVPWPLHVCFVLEIN